MKKNIKVYKNFLPQEYFNHLSNIVLSESDMPWFFAESVSGVPDVINFDSSKQYGFYHLLFNDQPNSHFFNDFIDILKYMANDYSIELINLKRMRLGMQVRIDKNPVINYPHVDYEEPHKVLLLYLNESDGDTVFYDDNMEILKSISPQPNSAVLFDGNILHSSSTPSKYLRRIALNINFNIVESEINDSNGY